MLWREAKENEDSIAGFPLLCCCLSFISAFVIVLLFCLFVFLRQHQKKKQVF